MNWTTIENFHIWLDEDEGLKLLLALLWGIAGGLLSYFSNIHPYLFFTYLVVSVILFTTRIWYLHR